MQTVIAGYAGVRVSYRTETMSISSLCIEGSTGTVLEGLNYLGSTLDISYDCADQTYPSYPTRLSVTMTHQGPFELLWYSSLDSTIFTLSLDNKIDMTLDAEAAATTTPVTLTVYSADESSKDDNKPSDAVMAGIYIVISLFAAMIFGIFVWVILFTGGGNSGYQEESKNLV